jgi:hypothetical protein
MVTIHGSSRRICRWVGRRCGVLSPRRTWPERMQEKTEKNVNLWKDWRFALSDSCPIGQMSAAQIYVKAKIYDAYHFLRPNLFCEGWKKRINLFLGHSWWHSIKRSF